MDLQGLDIPNKLRAQRKLLGMSMQDVATAAGLSVGYISQIERGLAQPSLTTLVTVAEILGMAVGDLVTVSTPVVGGISRHSERDCFTLGNLEAKYFPLTTGDGALKMSSVITEFPADFAFSGNDSHEGEELFYVLKGNIRLLLDGVPHLLGAGDSAHYSSKIPHNVKNVGSGEAKLLWVGTIKIFDEKPKGPIGEAEKIRLKKQTKPGKIQ